MIPSFKPGIMSSNRIRAAGGGADVTPNAVNWINTGDGSITQATTSMLQITGISQSITIRISWTSTGSGGTFEYSLQSTNVFGTATATLSSSPTDITVSPNQYLGFRLTAALLGTQTRSVTITNVSDSNTTLDTFVLTVGNDP